MSASVVQAVAEWIRTNGLSGHPARSREPSPAADRLHEADAVVADLRLLPEDLEGDAGNRDVRDTEVEGRRPDEPCALVPVADDPPVLYLDEGGETVGFTKAILGAQAFEVAFLEVLGRRRVIARDAELERKLGHSLDRIRRDPGNCRHR